MGGEHPLSQTTLFSVNSPLWRPRDVSAEDCTPGTRRGKGLCPWAAAAELSTLPGNVCRPESEASCAWTALHTNRQHSLLSPKLEAFDSGSSPCGHRTQEDHPQPRGPRLPGRPALPSVHATCSGRVIRCAGASEGLFISWKCKWPGSELINIGGWGVFV